MTLDRLSTLQQEKLCQIARQGMERAAEMLSRLLGQPVEVEVADAWMSDCRQREPLGDRQLGVCMQVSGDINGGLLLVLPEDCAGRVSARLLGTAQQDQLLAEPASSTLKEVGNIVASSFLACIDDQLGLRAMPSPPQLKRGPLAELLQDCRPSHDDACLIVRTRLLGSGPAGEQLQGAIYLFPDPAALAKLPTLLGAPEKLSPAEKNC